MSEMDALAPAPRTGGVGHAMRGEGVAADVTPEHDELVVWLVAHRNKYRLVHEPQRAAVAQDSAASVARRPSSRLLGE